MWPEDYYDQSEDPFTAGTQSQQLYPLSPPGPQYFTPTVLFGPETQRDPSHFGFDPNYVSGPGPETQRGGVIQPHQLDHNYTQLGDPSHFGFDPNYVSGPGPETQHGSVIQPHQLDLNYAQPGQRTPSIITVSKLQISMYRSCTD